jgi:polyisoprenoid-binding protein YceI
MKSLLLLLVLITLPAAAQDWTMDPGKSQLVFAIKQMNVPTEGGFKRFVARASFDPAKPEAGRFQIEVDINSIDTGTDDGDAEVKRPVWFDSARHPRATFVSKSVRKEANGSYTALGDMTIKGKTLPITTTVTKTGAGPDPWGNERVGLTATLNLDRIAFGVDYMPDGLGKQVEVMLSIEGIKKK